MKLSDKILVIANWLENSNNELLQQADKDEKCLDIVACAFINASTSLRKAAGEIEDIQPEEPVSQITPEALEEMAAVAEAFDASGDELLMKQASVLDEILLNFSAPKDWVFSYKKAEDDKLEELKKKYKEVREHQRETDKVAEAEKAIKAAPMAKQYRPLQHELQTRTCPDHAGAQMARIGENRFQCSLDHKIYDYKEGYTMLSGDKVPPGAVENQSQVIQNTGSGQIFDSRPERMGLDHGK